MRDMEQQIIDLLDGNLSTTEQTQVEALIQDDQLWQRTYHDYQKAIKTVKFAAEGQLRKELDAYLDQHLSHSKPSINKYLIYAGIAAVFLIAALVIGLFKTENKEPIRLQIEETPVHADSAQFDQDSIEIKKPSKDVDL